MLQNAKEKIASDIARLSHTHVRPVLHWRVGSDGVLKGYWTTEPQQMAAHTPMTAPEMSLLALCTQMTAAPAKRVRTKA